MTNNTEVSFARTFRKFRPRNGFFMPEFLFDSELFEDPEFMLDLVSIYGCFLDYAPENLKNDKEFILKAIRRGGMGGTLEYVTQELRGDRDVVLEAIKQYSSEIRYASEELKKDRDFIISALKIDGYVLETLFKLPDEKRGVEPISDREIILEAAKTYDFALGYATDELLDDREIMMAAVKCQGLNLRLASKKFRNDKKIVLAAVNNMGWALEYASKKLRADYEVVLAAVKNDGFALKFASDELRSDYNIITEAEKSHSWASHYALGYWKFELTEEEQKLFSEKFRQLKLSQKEKESLD